MDIIATENLCFADWLSLSLCMVASLCSGWFCPFTRADAGFAYNVMYLSVHEFTLTVSCAVRIGHLLTVTSLSAIVCQFVGL